MNKKIIFLQKANNFILSNKMKYIDWSLALGCLIYGFYLFKISDPDYIYWLVGGGIGVLFSYIRPANRLHNKITKQLTDKNK